MPVGDTTILASKQRSHAQFITEYRKAPDLEIGRRVVACVQQAYA